MNRQKIFIGVVIILILAGIFLRVISLDKDFSAEETDFVNAAIAIKNTGHPVYYLSEQWPREVALWHPPMYIYLLSVFLKISENEISARIINFIFCLLVSFLIFLFCSNLIENKKGKIMGLIASAFFLINYYVFSSSIMIDIDILSSFFVFGFFYFMLRYLQTEKRKFIVLSGIFLFFSVWNRYPAAGLAYLSLGIYFFYNKKLRIHFKKYLELGICTFLLFLISWGAYNLFVEPGNFFTFINHNASMGGEQLSDISVYISSFLLNIAQFIRLFTLPATILLIISVFYFIKKKNRSNITNFLLIYIIPILLFFILIPRPAFGYPRYFITAIPGMIILISIFAYKVLEKMKFTKKLIIFILLNILLCFGLLIMFNPQSTIYGGDGLIKATNFPDFIFNILCSLPILFVFLLKEKRKETLVFILMALMLSYSIFFDVKLVISDQNTKEAGLYIREHTEKNDLIIAPKAVSYYAGDLKVYTNDNNKPKLNFSAEYLNEYFTKSFQNRKMNDSFFWPEGIYSGIYDPAPTKEELERAVYVVKYYKVEGYEPEKIIGEFWIYRLK